MAAERGRDQSARQHRAARLPEMGERLREGAQARGLSLRTLADRLGVSPA